MKFLFTKLFFFLLYLVISDQLRAQSISLADGTALPVQYCWEDEDYALSGTPAGGTFSGCGVFEVGGQWFFNPLVATQNISVFPTSCTLTYTVEGNSTSVSLLIWKPVVITPPLADSFTCNGHFFLQATTLYAGAYEYAWTPASPLNLPDSPSTAGFISATQTFVLTAIDQTSGCMGSDTITIERYPEPELVVSNDTTINARGSVQLIAEGASTYQWSPGYWLSNDTIPNPVASPRAPLTYQVVGINEYGCSDTAEVKIDIRDHIFVPNAFSPNGDGVNDVFRMENYGYQSIHAFMIFNRWGEKVFQTIDGSQGWDGSYKGQPAEAGTYYYVIRLGQIEGPEQVLKGALTLLR